MSDHDHSNDPKVWCETHQHVHIAMMPRFTYLCKSCGWGQWYKVDAIVHEETCPGHETYEVEHVMVPMPSVNLERLQKLEEVLALVKKRHGNCSCLKGL